MVVLLAGIDEVLIGADPGQLSYRPNVGRRPLDVAISPDGTTAYVADSLDDTVSVVELESGLRRKAISLGPCPDPTPAERGERMFFDARISHGGWMSCHSCHTDGHTSGVNSDTLGDGDFGAPKRIPSLLGVAHTPPWGWSGNFARLEDQVRQSIDTTMQGLRPTDAQVADLVAYLRTLPAPAPAPVAAPSTGAAVEHGQRVFNRECARCHAAPEYTTPRRYDVGLPDEAGNRRFNPPSLRGVGRREPLLHDGRARTLEEVFVRHKHPDGLRLAPEEVADLVSFLRRL
jgi:cytochrome c peroxidase